MENKKEDISNYHKGNYIANEAVELLNSETASSNSNALDDFAKDNTYSKELFNKLTNSDKISEIVSQFNRPDKYENVNLLINKIENRKKRYKLKVALYSIFSVASALIAVSFLVTYLSKESVDKVDIAVVDNSKISSPTLILNSGEAIDLTNISTKIISNNHTTTKIEGNNLKYTKNKYTENSKASNNVVETKYNTMIIPSEYTYNITLDDGTEVILNANSEFKYPTLFNGEKREVFLKGEAFFKVKKGKKPFIVNTSDMRVKVYGTSFNINTNSAENIETLLVSGSVGVTTLNTDYKEVIIKPSELFSYNSVTDEITVKEVDIDRYINWKSGYFNCTRESLKSLMDELSVWYGVSFEFESENISEIGVSVVNLKRKLSIDEILPIIERMADVEISKINGEKYMIR